MDEPSTWKRAGVQGPPRRLGAPGERPVLVQTAAGFPLLRAVTVSGVAVHLVAHFTLPVAAGEAPPGESPLARLDHFRDSLAGLVADGSLTAERAAAMTDDAARSGWLWRHESARADDRPPMLPIGAPFTSDAELLAAPVWDRQPLCNIAQGWRPASCAEVMDPIPRPLNLRPHDPPAPRRECAHCADRLVDLLARAAGPRCVEHPDVAAASCRRCAAPRRAAAEAREALEAARLAAAVQSADTELPPLVARRDELVLAGPAGKPTTRAGRAAGGRAAAGHDPEYRAATAVLQTRLLRAAEEGVPHRYVCALLDLTDKEHRTLLEHARAGTVVGRPKDLPPRLRARRTG